MSNSRDYITVYDQDGNSKDMEIVLSFRLEDSAKNCIIYKDDVKYYTASYDDVGDRANLNTDFTEEEKEQIQKIFNQLVMGVE